MVKKIAEALEQHGVRVWLDKNELRVGDSLREKIEEALLLCDFVAVALSKRSIKSSWVQRELNAAFVLEAERKKKVILPILLQRIVIPLFLRDKRHADFSANFESGLSDLLKALSGPTFFERHNLKTIKCRVFLDIKRKDGRRALYKKVQTHKCTKGKINNYIESLSSDGTLSNFRVIPGTIVKTWLQSGTTHVRSDFRRPLKKNQTLRRTLSCTFNNSFMKADEYWEQRQYHPSQNVEIIIRFPKNRPPKEFRACEKEATVERELSGHLKYVRIKGKPALRFFIQRPRFLWSYLIRWTW